jgi:hypothetical protein
MLGLVVLLCHVASALASEPPKQRITAASGVRMRATPGPSGQEVAKLFIGTVLRELERSEKQEKVGRKKDHWYRVATPEGQEGWVFGSFTLPFEPERRVELSLEIATQRLGDEKAPFVDRADLANFLKREAEQAADKASQGKLELAYWRAVRWALQSLDVAEPPKEAEGWVKRKRDALVYSEPAGLWFVNRTVLWELEEKYRGTPEGEAFAWEAATTPPPGECEGYPPCYLSISNEMEGEYFQRYPEGPHVGEALKTLEPVLEQQGLGELDKDGRAELLKELDSLEKALGKVKAPQKKKVLAKLRAMRKAAGG